ncbi:MAG: hypothetical protein Kow0099_22860 [Candidatus Abyssubacteria bacterium]
MKRFHFGMVWVAGVVLLSMVITACGSKVNEANFEKIETGMSKKQVYEILGPPDESSSVNIGGMSGAASTWTDKEATISIQFLNDKVTAKQFAKSGEGVGEAD